MPGVIETWLLCLADPLGLGRPLPRPLMRGELVRLLELANGHGVLPAVTANMSQQVHSAGARSVAWSADEATAQAQLDEALAPARATLLDAAGRTMVLTRQAQTLSAGFLQRGIVAVILKGSDFAQRLYPQAGLRPFRDVDLLISQKDLPQAQQALRELDYAPEPAPTLRYSTGYAEETWLPASGPGGGVELHWNLVNSPTLRRGLSVDLADLTLTQTPGAAPSISPSSQLLIAAVHGAASHAFDRLQILCDIAQCVREFAGPLDRTYLQDALGRQRARRLAMASALRLTYRAMGEPACRQLLDSLGLHEPISAHLAVTVKTVLHAQSPLGVARRKWYRQMLKKQ